MCDAREAAEAYFERIRSEGQALRALRDRLRASRERATAPATMGFGGTCVSRTRRRDRIEASVLGLIMTEAELLPKVAAMVAEQERARAILYGDGSPCLLDHLGPRYAEVVGRHYLDGETWERVADALSKSRRTVCRMKDVAFEVMDEEGLIC